MKIYENIPKNLILENFNKKLHDRLIELGCKPLWAAKVEPDQIVIEQGLYPREQTDWEQVEIYKEDMLKGDQFPTVIITAKDGQYILVDGNHRVWAGKKANKKINTEFWDIPEHLIEYVATIANTLGRGKQGKDLTGKVKKKEIIKAYEKGINRNIKQLAEDFETTEGYIKKVLSEAGLIKDEKQKLKEKAFELREQGYTQQEIANELGVSDRTIRNWFSEKEEKNYHGKNFPEDQTEPDWSDWNETEEIEEQDELDQETTGWNEEDNDYEKPEERKSKKTQKENQFKHPNEVLEKLKESLWAVLVEIEFRFNYDTAIDVLSEIYTQWHNKSYKQNESYKDWRAELEYKRLKGKA
ncbi:MAG TPA: hypothetical protein EYH56_03240 [Nanoarchaeota archaeon]|nr:hypothetical protein [Nanoarchaeota archaeon]